MEGAKKVQQDLAAPGVLEAFAQRAGVGIDGAAQIRQLFAGLWGLDDMNEPGTKAAVADAMANPANYVLKPQREVREGGRRLVLRSCIWSLCMVWWRVRRGR